MTSRRIVDPKSSVPPGNVPQWFVVARWRALLGDTFETTVRGWADAQTATIVKHGAGRVVYRVDRAGQAFYVKRFSTNRVTAWLRRWWRGSAADLEFRRSLELAERGIPVAEAVACGVWRAGFRHTEDFLVTAAVPASVSLREYVAAHLHDLPPAVARRRRRRLLAALAELLARFHAAGAVHRDLHGGNVLVSLVDVDRPRLYLVDLPAVDLRDQVSWSARRRNLVMLNSEWRSRISRAERRWLLRRYLRLARSADEPDWRQATRELLPATRVYACRLQQRRERRALATNGDFYKLPWQGTKVYVHRSVPPVVATAWCVALSRGETGPAWVQGDHQNALAALPVAGRSWWEQLVNPAANHPALELWARAQGLLARGITVRRPWLVCAPGPGPSAPGWLVVDEHRNWPTLASYASASGPMRARQQVARARQVARALGTWWGRLHAWQGATDPTFTLGELLVNEDRPVIELVADAADAVRLESEANFQRAVDDLSRHWHHWPAGWPRSRTLRTIFLRAYVQAWDDERPEYFDALVNLLQVTFAARARRVNRSSVRIADA